MIPNWTKMSKLTALKIFIATQFILFCASASFSAQSSGYITRVEPLLNMVAIDGRLREVSGEAKIYRGFSEKNTENINSVRINNYVMYRVYKNKIVELRIFDKPIDPVRIVPLVESSK